MWNITVLVEYMLNLNTQQQTYIHNLTEIGHKGFIEMAFKRITQHVQSTNSRTSWYLFQVPPSQPTYSFTRTSVTREMLI